MLQRCYHWFHDFLNHPGRVFWASLFLVGFGVVVDGTAFRLWSLNRDHDHLLVRIEEGRRRAGQLDMRLREAQRPEFIEKAVRDQFDLVKEGDLIFIFAEEAVESVENKEKPLKTGG